MGAWNVRVSVRLSVRVKVKLTVTWSVDAFGICMALVELVVSALVNVCALDAITTEASLALALVGAWNVGVMVRVRFKVKERVRAGLG